MKKALVTRHHRAGRRVSGRTVAVKRLWSVRAHPTNEYVQYWRIDLMGPNGQVPDREKISIIVPVFKDLDVLRSCLESLYALVDKNYEIIVVDDASQEDVLGMCDPGRVRVVRLLRNLGPGVARNEGAACAVGSILAFIDADCTAPPDWLSRIRVAFADSRVVAVAGSYAGSHVKGLTSEVRFLEVSYYHRKERSFVSAFLSANFAIRADIFRKVGGFPPIRIGEDLLLGYKLKLAGFEVLWLSDLCVGHHFHLTLWCYFQQQLSWGRGSSTIAICYPDTMILKWNVRRNIPQLQLALQGISMLGILLPVGVGGTWWVSVIAGVGCLVLNVPFVRYINQTRSLVRTCQCLLVVLCVRNLAWLVGMSIAVATYPLTTLKGMGIWLSRVIGWSGAKAELSWDYVGTDFPPRSDWYRLSRGTLWRA